MKHKFQLIIDGCNGPIRFREDFLRKAAAAATSTAASRTTTPATSSSIAIHGDDAYGESCTTTTPNALSKNDVGVDTILSLLRPESIAADPLRKQTQTHKKNKSRRKAKGGRWKHKNNHGQPKPYSTTSSTRNNSSTVEQTETADNKNNNECVVDDEESSISNSHRRRLDMIPLLQKLLISSKQQHDADNVVGDDGTNSNDKVNANKKQQHRHQQLFDSIVVLFDGVSTTKRPSLPVVGTGNNAPIWGCTKSNREETAIETREEEIAKGRVWHVRMSDSDIDSSNATVTAVQMNTTTSSIANAADSYSSSSSYSSRKEYPSGCLAIEVTGLYEEADNVIVERLQESFRPRTIIRIDRERERHQVPTMSFTRTTCSIAGSFTSITVMRRTERGAGKNRRLFQPLGLLRPESVACVFDFYKRTPPTTKNTSTTTSTSNCDELRSEYQEEECKSSSRNSNDSLDRKLLPKPDSDSHSAPPFRKLSLDGCQTLRSVRCHNSDNVFVVLDEPIKVPFDTDAGAGAGAGAAVGSDGGNDEPSSTVVPLQIIVTDDVFLRQRIIREDGYVMTFHQLWLLLIDVVNN